MWIVIAVGAIVVAIVFLKLKAKSDKYRMFEGITMKQFIFGSRLLAQQLAKYKQSKFTKLETPAFTALLAQDAESAKFILSNPELFPKAKLNVLSSATDLMKDGIVVVNDDQWRRYRNVLSPPFHFDAVKQWIPDFYKLSLELADQWTQQINQPIDIVRWMPLFTLDALGVTVLSRSFNAMKGEEDKDLAAVKVLLGGLGKPSTFILGMLEKYTGLNMLKDLNNAVKDIKHSISDIVNSKRSQSKNDGHFDLVDVMLQAHDPKWNESELISNTFTMFVAGHETTATALTWLFYHLATNQHVQGRLIEEIKQVLKGQPIQPEHIKELHYLTNVLKENMRIQPPIAMLFTRTVAHDAEFNGMVLPKDSRCGVNIYAIHRSPEYWDNPEEFNPDRFDKPTIPFAYLPFSLKSRACLGNQFSLVEQTVFVSILLQRFRVKSLSSFVPPRGNNPVINQVVELKVNLDLL